MDPNSKIMKYKEVLHIVSKYSGGVFVKQATDSEGGHGVRYAQSRNDFHDAVSKIKGDIIIQEPLIQHEALSRLNSSSVNTIRIL